MFTVRPLKARRAFSLIELLVVIAVIAILAALLFPVFASVREKARQATVISNMHQIQLGMAAYQLDYHKYPDVLFGYADGTNSMSAYKPLSGTVPTLYPSYVKDYHVFLDPNNNADPAVASATAMATVNTIGATGTLTTTPKTFYTADAYDLSPRVTGNNALDTTSTGYIARYQLSWTALNATMASTLGADYQRQLRWRSQPGDTYVTCSTYHVPNAGKVILLQESGTAKVIDTTKFVSGSGGTGTEGANFWKVQP